MGAVQHRQERQSPEEQAARLALDAAKRARWLQEGQEVRALRVARGLTQEQLAAILGLRRRQDIHMIERGIQPLAERCWGAWLEWRDGEPAPVVEPPQ